MWSRPQSRSATVRLEEALVEMRRMAEEVKLAVARRALAEAERAQMLQEVERVRSKNDSINATVADVASKLEAFSKQQAEVATENDRLREQVLALAKELEVTQKRHAAELHAKDLERQLALAKLAQADTLTAKYNQLASGRW